MGREKQETGEEMTITKAWPSMLRRAIKKGLVIIGPDGDWWELIETGVYYNHSTRSYMMKEAA